MSVGNQNCKHYLETISLEQQRYVQMQDPLSVVIVKLIKKLRKQF
jgi:hypothetical protein